MQKKIARGRVLRELLKQDRLSPLSLKGQMAWLTAFNHGDFDTVPTNEVKSKLDALLARAETGS